MSKQEEREEEWQFIKPLTVAPWVDFVGFPMREDWDPYQYKDGGTSCLVSFEVRYGQRTPYGGAWWFHVNTTPEDMRATFEQIGKYLTPQEFEFALKQLLVWAPQAQQRCALYCATHSPLRARGYMGADREFLALEVEAVEFLWFDKEDDYSSNQMHGCFSEALGLIVEAETALRGMPEMEAAIQESRRRGSYSIAQNKDNEPNSNACRRLYDLALRTLRGELGDFQTVRDGYGLNRNISERGAMKAAGINYTGQLCYLRYAKWNRDQTFSLTAETIQAVTNV